MSIEQVGNKLVSVKYKDAHKVNTSSKGIRGTCVACLQKVSFRVISINKQNRISCTRCLTSIPLNRKAPVKESRLIKKKPLTKNERLSSKWFLIKEYFLGNHIWLPFRIRRRSKLGVFLLGCNRNEEKRKT